MEKMNDVFTDRKSELDDRYEKYPSSYVDDNFENYFFA